MQAGGRAKREAANVRARPQPYGFGFDFFVFEDSGANSNAFVTNVRARAVTAGIRYELANTLLALATKRTTQRVVIQAIIPSHVQDHC
jgi:hypothetical protein